MTTPATTTTAQDPPKAAEGGDPTKVLYPDKKVADPAPEKKDEKVDHPADKKDPPAEGDKKDPPEKKEPDPAEGAGKKDEKPKPEDGKPVVPEKYELKVPEGSVLDKSHVEKVAAFAKTSGLTQEQAQAVLARDHQALVAQEEALNQRREQWIEDTKSDREIGGEAFKQNVEHAKQAIAKFGSDAFREELEKTRLGNHPELVRVFARIGKAMAPDKLVPPKTPQGGKKSHEESLYGPSKQ